MSQEQTVQTGPRPTVAIERVAGNLSVRGWGEQQVQVRTPDEELHLDRSESGEEQEVVSLRCHGDCQLFVPYEASLIVEEARADAYVEDVHGAVTLVTCRGNLVVSKAGPTTLEHLDADVVVKEIDGGLAIDHVAGSANLSQIRGSLRVGNCAGDLSAKEIHGAANLDNIAGNTALAHIHGDLRIGHCAGDLSVKSAMGALVVDEVSGNCSTLHVEGDVHIADCAGDLAVRGRVHRLQADAHGSAALRLILLDGGQCTVEAGGDITCRIPPDVDARVRLASGGDIRVKRLPVSRDVHAGQAEFTLGNGTGEIDLKAGGDILLLGKPEESPDFQFGGFGVEMDAETQREFVERTGDWIRQVTEQVEEQLDTISAQVDARLAQMGTGEEIAARVQQKVQQAMRKAEEKVAEAMRKAEARARAAEREAERRERRERRHSHVYSYQTPPRPPVPPTPPTPPRPKRAPTSDEERMLILRMVEQGKISVEQAEKLLAALEG